MSLARTLLNGVSESAIDITGFECGEVSMESSTLDSACEALLTDIYTVDKAYHTADIIGEVQVLKEGADGEALLEGMISSGIEKLKNAFKKFWAKIQAWFAAVKKYFKSLYLKGKDFVKEFKKEITDKKATGFKYHAFHYTLGTGDSKAIDGVFKKINDEIDRCATGLTKDASDKRNLDDIAKRMDSVGNYDQKDSDKPEYMKTGSDFQEAIIKKLGVPGATTVSELTEELAKAYRNGETEAEDFEEFESNSKDEMLDLVENSDKKIKDFEKAESAFEKDVNAIIKALDKIKKEDVNGSEILYKKAQRRSSQASALLSLGKIPCDVQVAAYKEAASSYRSILGSFVRFKPAKEGAEMDDEDTMEGCGGKKKCGSSEACSESLLDVAMNLL